MRDGADERVSEVRVRVGRRTGVGCLFPMVNLSKYGVDLHLGSEPQPVLRNDSRRARGGARVATLIVILQPRTRLKRNKLYSYTTELYSWQSQHARRSEHELCELTALPRALLGSCDTPALGHLVEQGVVVGKEGAVDVLDVRHEVEQVDVDLECRAHAAACGPRRRGGTVIFALIRLDGARHAQHSARHPLDDQVALARAVLSAIDAQLNLESAVHAEPLGTQVLACALGGNAEGLSIPRMRLELLLK